MNARRIGLLTILLAALFAPPAIAQQAEPLGADLDKFTYPWPVERFEVAIGATSGQMAYMDIAPTGAPNGRSVVLLHGKNFCGATWQSTAQALLQAGYRVLIPDQVGFCKSSKPPEAQYSFAMLADFTARLMAARELGPAILIGHSTGGMLAMHFALMYPDQVERLVLINPLGLTDRMAEGVPYVPLDRLIQQEQAKDRAAIRQYQLTTYYHGEWQQRYDRWVDMLAGQYASEDAEKVVIAQAKASEMILTQPVSQHLERLTMPITLMIGMRDTTTFGKGQAPAAIAETLKPIPALAPAAAQRMPDARLIRFPELGHSPQVEDPARFEKELLSALEG